MLRGELGIGRAFSLVGAWLIFACPGMIPALAFMKAHPFSEEASIIYFQGASHHLDIFRPSMRFGFIGAALLLTAPLLLRRVRPGGQPPIRDGLLVSAMACVAAYWAMAMLRRFTLNYSMLRSYPMRTWTFIVIMATTYGVRSLRAIPAHDRSSKWLSDLLGRQPSPILAAAALVALFAFAIRHPVESGHDGAPASDRSHADDLQEFYSWARERTPAGSAFLLPEPFWWTADFQWRTERGSSFMYKSFPITSEGLVQWNLRRELCKKFYEKIITDHEFSDELGAVLGQLEPDYVVVPTKADPGPPTDDPIGPLIPAFRNMTYTVYQATAGRSPPESARPRSSPSPGSSPD
jgi:hypothetical protein